MKTLTRIIEAAIIAAALAFGAACGVAATVLPVAVLCHTRTPLRVAWIAWSVTFVVAFVMLFIGDMVDGRG